MQRVRVYSSTMASVGYDAASSKLQIEFTSGSIYEYRNIPEHIK